MIFLLLGLLGIGGYVLTRGSGSSSGALPPGTETAHDSVSNTTFVIRTTSPADQVIKRRDVLESRALSGPAVLKFSQSPDGSKKLLSVLNNDPNNMLVVAARRAMVL